MEFKSQHNLIFEVAPWEFSDEFTRFRVGTVSGLWRSTVDSYDILAIENKCSGNGHLNDVFEWFENSCKRDNKILRVIEILNERFGRYLINERGFKKVTKTVVQKRFN